MFGKTKLFRLSVSVSPSACLSSPGAPTPVESRIQSDNHEDPGRGCLPLLCGWAACSSVAAVRLPWWKGSVALLMGSLFPSFGAASEESHVPGLLVMPHNI